MAATIRPFPSLILFRWSLLHTMPACGKVGKGGKPAISGGAWAAASMCGTSIFL
jgi:hypothetical protein